MASWQTSSVPDTPSPATPGSVFPAFPAGRPDGSVNVSAMSKLVLVADTSWVANQVETALAVAGWDIEVVTDPRQAVDRVNEVQPDAVIVDMQVGSKGGMAVVRAIRQSAELRPRLVLLLDRNADTFIARRAGADASVLKPIKANELRTALSGDEEE